MNRHDRGVAVYTEIFELPAAEALQAMTDRVGPEFANEAFEAAGGAAWSHPALSSRERDIAIITAFASQGVGGDRLRSHIELGLRNGLDRGALTALMTLLAIYIGYAHASTAMELITAMTGEPPDGIVQPGAVRS